MKGLLVVCIAVALVLVIALALAPHSQPQPAAAVVVAPEPTASPTPIPTQLDLDKEFVAKHRAEYACSGGSGELGRMASSLCLDNLRMQMELVEAHYGYDFGHQYDLCLAYEPTKPKNIVHCKKVFQQVDKMNKQYDDAEARRKSNW